MQIVGERMARSSNRVVRFGGYVLVLALVALDLFGAQVYLESHWSGPALPDVLGFVANHVFAVLALGLVASMLLSRPKSKLPRQSQGGVTTTEAKPQFRVSVRNAIDGPAADCHEDYLDCASLIVTNDGAPAQVSIGLRPEGIGHRVWLLRNGKEREFTMHTGDSVAIGLFVRTRKSVSWGTTNPRNIRANLAPGPCYIFDEIFELTGTPNVVLKAGRHLLSIDVVPTSGVGAVTVEFNMFVPDDPQKSIWMQRV